MMTRQRAGIAAVGLLIVVALAGWALARTGRVSEAPGQAAQTVHPRPTDTAVRQPAAGTQQSLPPRRFPAANNAAAAPSTAAPDASHSGASDGGGLDAFLEAENGELTDVLAHLQKTCAAPGTTGNGTRLDPRAVAACVADTEQAGSLVRLIRESVESPAGADMPGNVRARWTGTLASNARAITRALVPVDRAIGRRLARGDASPETRRTLGHLRDRIDRVLNGSGA